MPQKLRIARRSLAGPAPLGTGSFGEGAEILLLDGGPLRPRGDLPIKQQTVEQHVEQQADLALAALAPRFYLEAELRVMASLAGGDAKRVVTRVAAQLANAGSPHAQIGLVRGEDLLDQLESLMQAGAALAHRDTGEPFASLTKPIVAAAALFDHRPLAAALRQDARVTIIGHADTQAMLGAAAVSLLEWPEPKLFEKAVTAAAPLLAGGDDQIEIANDGTARSAFSEHLAESADAAVEARPNETEATILYRDGFTAACLLESPKEAQTESLFSELESAAQGGKKFDLSVYQASSSEARPLVRVHIEADGVAKAQASLAGVLGAAQRAGASVVEDFPPRVSPNYGIWPTSVPSDLIEWSVDVRSAKEWLAR